MIEQETNVPKPSEDLAPYGALLEVAQQERRIKEKQGYMHAYVISVLFPPMGLFYFFKYLFFANGTREDVQAGVISLTLTVAAIVLSIWSLAALLQQASPTGAGSTMDLLKKTSSPENMKELIKLYQ